MASVNRVTLLGHIGKEPETRYAPSGDAICNLTLATTETWRDKTSGEKREATEWHRVVFFGKLAEIANQYLKKGSLVYIEGSLRTRKWQDKDGQDRYTTEIRADEMKMLGGRQSGGQGDDDAGSNHQNGNGGNRPNGNNGNQRDPSRQSNEQHHQGNNRQGGGDNRQGNNGQGNGGNRQGNRPNGNSGGAQQNRPNQGGGRSDHDNGDNYGPGNGGGNFGQYDDDIPF